MLKVAFVGWRGLVGSVLMDCLKKENGFAGIDPHFFSSTTGENTPKHPLNSNEPVKNSYDLEELQSYNIIVSCQGSSYTEKVYYELREKNWQGYWLDAASHLRRKEESTLVLDPVNGEQIQKALKEGKKDFIGANCTVSLMLLAIQGILDKGLVEWIHSATYQAVSGAGSVAIQSLLDDNKKMSRFINKDSHTLEQMDAVHSQFKTLYPEERNLASNLLPWIDKEDSPGKTLEESKGFYETNKILGRDNSLPVDGTCVRVPVLRSHSQVLTLKLKEDPGLQDLENLISGANDWVKVVPNNRKATLHHLSPLCSSDSLDILVGRVRKLNFPGTFYEVFTVGDQLLWGASEPIRRCLKLIVDFILQKG